MYRGADKSLARPGRKQANVSVRMAWISFGALPCKGGGGLMTACVSMLLKSRAYELVSFLVGLRTYQHPVVCKVVTLKTGTLLSKSASFIGKYMYLSQMCFTCPSQNVFVIRCCVCIICSVVHTPGWRSRPVYLNSVLRTTISFVREV